MIVRQLGRETPTVLGDELIFGRLAQNVAHGDGLTFRGEPSPYKTLYPFLIAPAWSLFKANAAYHAALALNAVVMTATFFPAYALARRVAGFWWAVAAGAGAALTPAMVWAGMLMTEALAYPLSTLALLAMVAALREPGRRWTGAAFAAIAAATAVRAQMAVLFPIFALAVGMDIVRFGRRDIGRRLRAHRLALTGFALVALAGALVELTGSRRSVLGEWSGFLSQGHVRAAGLLELGADYLGILLIASLALPLMALVILGLRRASWAERELGPILVVGAAASVLLIALAAWSSSAAPGLRERYVFYATPVLAACWVALPGRARWAPVTAVTAAAVAYLLVAFPGFADVDDESVQQSLDSLTTRVFGGHVGVVDLIGSQARLLAMAVGALGLAAAASTVVRGRRAPALLLVVPTLLFGFLVLNVRQDQANRDSRQQVATLAMPLDWIDRHTSGPVMLVETPRTSVFRIWNLELWNHNLDRVAFVGKPVSDIRQPCELRLGREGSLTLTELCGGRGLPRYLAVADRSLSIANGRLVARGRGGERVYESEEPRLAQPLP